MKPIVAVYRDHLIYPSETFVLGQAEALKRFVPYYVGSRRVRGLSVPTARTVVANEGSLSGRVHEISYKLWGLAPAFVKRVRRLKPVLIHAHYGPEGVRALPLARALQIPLLVTFHGFDATTKDEYAKRSFYGHRVYVRRREKLKHEAQLFIAVSQFIQDKLLEQGFPPEKILVHYVGVDTRAFRADPTQARGPVVLFVGRLVENKGCEFLIRAMSRVQSLAPEAELVVIGDGPLRPSLELLAGKTLRRWRFLGVRPQKEVRSWMNCARVFSVPSVTSVSGASEGFGIVFAEAQAMGLPVASFATGGIPEVVSHGETGLLAAERDWEGLARHISSLLSNDSLWRRLSAAGQARVRDLFDLRRQTGALEEIYDRVLSEEARDD